MFYWDDNNPYVTLTTHNFYLLIIAIQMLYKDSNNSYVLFDTMNRIKHVLFSDNINVFILIGVNNKTGQHYFIFFY